MRILEGSYSLFVKFVIEPVIANDTQRPSHPLCMSAMPRAGVSEEMTGTSTAGVTVDMNQRPMFFKKDLHLSLKLPNTSLVLTGTR